MTGKKTKIALCLSGEARSSMLSFPYIYESFINLNPEFEVDVFIHTWKDFRSSPLYNPKKLYIDYSSEDEIYMKYINEIENFEEDVKLERDQFHLLPVKHTVLMHYGLKNVFELTKDQKYDYYIRCRLDILLKNKIDIFYILNKLKFENKDIWIPHSYNQPNWEFECNDQLAIGNYKGMSNYFNCFKNIPKLIHQTKSYLPEVLLGNHLKNCNLNIEWGQTDYVLVRKSFIQSHPFQKIYLDQ